MHWKIARDPYLSPLCAKHGDDAALEAGFFFDEDPDDARLDDVDWWCTPRPKLPVTGERPVVLLATGGFCPVHAGHLEMMELARDAAQAAGLSVIGGYLSPGHDDYLRLKCGDAAIPAQERLRLCADAVASSDWLCVDPWESMARRVSVNYTDVTARLQAYLRAHVDPRIEVVYVCGGDNARFALAFSELGRCIVVGRPGTAAEHGRWRERMADHPRVMWAHGSSSSLSSRMLRADQRTTPESPRLVVRLEDARVVKTLGLDRIDAFQNSLLSLLAAHGTVRCEPLVPRTLPADVISLDAMTHSGHNLAISRCFALGGYEARGHVARPGAASIERQVAAIPPGNYGLYDDDSVTGSTLRAARALLPGSVVVLREEVAVSHAPEEEVIDARDFLLGTDDGGLVVELPHGALGRAPYVLPYVDPYARASIAASHDFSIAIWELNARIFASTDLRVHDLPPPSRVTFAQFPADTRLEALCQWHAERLRAFASPRTGALPTEGV